VLLQPHYDLCADRHRHRHLRPIRSSHQSRTQRRNPTERWGRRAKPQLHVQLFVVEDTPGQGQNKLHIILLMMCCAEIKLAAVALAKAATHHKHANNRPIVGGVVGIRCVEGGETKARSLAHNDNHIYIRPPHGPPIREAVWRTPYPGQDTSRICPEICPEFVQNLYRNCTEIVQKLYRNCTEIVQKLYSNYFV
jgi:hypothetical protein